MTLLQVASDVSTNVQNAEELIKTTSKIGWRLVIDLISVFCLIRFIYYPIYKHRDLFFTFFIFNIIIFLISFLLNKVDLSMGAAFGLFAVFSMLRYRTEDISIKDMTYLFLTIAIGLVTAVTKIKDTDDSLEYLFLGSLNGVILLITYLLESNFLMKKETSKTVLFENIELIKAGRGAELLADLKERTGMNIHRYSVQKIDFLKDAAYIKIYYYE
ncbi:MAG: DUF4956 domain-containing protein [Bacteroidetes bacterium]|nr:DUF4956 domain-containing protein [Bacteroidota bacterium]